MFNIQQFEDDARTNGIRYWLAHEFMASLGYETWVSFKSVIHKAMGSCLQLGIDADESFIPIELPDGTKSYKLTRFACFLVAMQANPSKPEVAAAQVSLAAIAEALVEEKLTDAGFARVEERSKLTAAEKQLTGIAHAAGLREHSDYAIFKDQGFRGMYNMSLRDVQVRKGAPACKTLYDFMGLTELAANTFRITQTAARIQSQKVKGLTHAARTAKDVGSEVRDVMLRSSGIAPEDIRLEGHIGDVKKQIKSANRKMNKLDADAMKRKQIAKKPLKD